MTHLYFYLSVFMCPSVRFETFLYRFHILLAKIIPRYITVVIGFMNRNLDIFKNLRNYYWCIGKLISYLATL
jgi:hypothetical protein